MSQSTDNQVSSAPAGAPTATKPSATSLTKIRKLPPWNVVLLNDDDHSYPYVIEMLLVIAAIDPERGQLMATELDTTGRVIVLTTHREKAELKQDQIHGFGIDARISRCKGSMSAVLEPAEA